MKELPSGYDPRSFETEIYNYWLENNCFDAEVCDDKPSYTIVIPPPNVTGKLHMGHALDETLQDILVRFKRMQGYSALWVPGTDHAGIATQIKVEEHLRNNEGLTRHQLGREAFLSRVWKWKEQYGSNIINQLKRLGCSCDWRRERFTMDEDYCKAVRRVFVSLYEKGLIYQGERIISWCPSCLTALSDAEVEYFEKNGHLWHIKYMVKDSDDFIVIATTRPETLLGDAAVAVHPDDPRYSHLIGKTLILPLCRREIPVITDSYVDMEFATGAVKITPAHDPNDFEVGLRHNLPQIKIMNDDASISNSGGKYSGMDRYAARKAIVSDLRDAGLLVNVKEYTHNVSQCYRCGSAVEPLISKQWFVKMKPLAEDAIEVVKSGEVKFVPERFSKIYLGWMENVHDWCISRQLWWGHRIPAFFCDGCGFMTVSEADETICPECGSQLNQDEDVLDTWFSSALWPFAVFGFPEKTEELDYFYPTSVLVTGYDIIFFWVARMVFSAMFHMKKIPFSDVLIHGLVRDEHGRKMSKSLGNGVDPMEIAEKYGADALRFSLVTGNSPGNDMRFYIKKVEAAGNFANKLWNAARFVILNLPQDFSFSSIELPQQFSVEDGFILGKYKSLASEMNENIEKYELGIALSKLYDFVWDEYCDWYIEVAKINIFQKNAAAGNNLTVLAYVLCGVLKLLHPFMPFMTEKIYSCLCDSAESISLCEFPSNENVRIGDCSHCEGDFEILKSVIRGVRNIRAEKSVPFSVKTKVSVVTDSPAVFEQCGDFLAKMLFASELSVYSQKPDFEYATVSFVCPHAEVFICTDELVDKGKEASRLQKEKRRLEKELQRLEAKLSNRSFLEKAPQNIVREESEKYKTYKDMLSKVEDSIKSL